MTTITQNPFDNLPILYHGTTAKSWRTTHAESSTLYVTLTRSDAELYAQETFESEYEENPRGKVKVFAIHPDRLKHLLNSEGIALEPDWGWVEAQEREAARTGVPFTDADATWEKSLNACGSIAISGFIDTHKRLFKALTEEVRLDANSTL